MYGCNAGQPILSTTFLSDDFVSCNCSPFQVIEGLDTLVTVESLFLGKNKIEKLQVREHWLK